MTENYVMDELLKLQILGGLDAEQLTPITHNHMNLRPIHMYTQSASNVNNCPLDAVRPFPMR